MDIQSAIIDQYGSALEMLKQAMVQCPPALWDDLQGRKRFWLVAYHALFYTHLYLSDNLGAFKPWEKYRQGIHRLGSAPEKAQTGEPYSREEMLEFLSSAGKQWSKRSPLKTLRPNPALNGCPSTSWSSSYITSATSSTMRLS